MITTSITGFSLAPERSETFCAVNPATRQSLPGNFSIATLDDLQLAAEKAWSAWQTYRYFSGARKAAFLRAIATEIEQIGPALIERAMAESGLPEGRLLGECGRTCGQLRLFADLLEEGSWVQATIETALPDRQPFPRPDIRNMLVSIGPVAVFGASNFPLAFSTAGGDTASALAAGCPVIVKAHPSHPGTHALIAEAILRAARQTEMPDGVFSALFDEGRTIGVPLVQHPRIKAVGFTGSFGGGMALLQAAAVREEPIPVFAEMGSTNPVFLLPEKIKNHSAQLAQMLAGSVNLGAGQFCTNPGLLVLLEDEHTSKFVENLRQAFEKLTADTMLNEGIYQNFERAKNRCLQIEGVQAEYIHNGAEGEWRGWPAVASVNAAVFLAQKDLREEVFGPFTLVVKCADKRELEAVAEHLKGQLTATLLGTPDELPEWTGLARRLSEKVGRLLFDGVPTGVEVCHAMQHGGPFPATTDARFTSVGTGAIRRFVRPVAFQNCPPELLPDELKPDNPLGIWRKVNGEWQR
ncbi:MAG: aldehyde dehydrogenase (NADP(+)) [Bacteroidetes bacterium]|nr:MAG: aldehyde dehydrogenase (NADP(+)) [Bacteroidota bacterium]